MKELLKRLKAEQEELAQQKECLKKRKDAFEKEMKVVKDIISSSENEIENIKAELTPLAIAEYELSKCKTVTGGLKIQDTKKTSYVYDQEKALSFAKEKGLWLQLDKKTFEKAIPGLGKVDFITENTETGKRITFPKEIILEDGE